MTKVCNIWRKANNFVVHPWLLHTEGTANRALAEDEAAIFGLHPDDSIEVLSEVDTSLTQPNTAGLSACHVSMTGTLSSDEDDYLSDSSDKDHHPKPHPRKLSRHPIPARLRQSHQGRNRVKVGAPTKVHGRIHLSKYSLSASSKGGSVPAYSLMVCSKVPARSLTHKMAPTTVLFDTEALVSLMPL